MSAPAGEPNTMQPDSQVVRLTADLDVDVCVVGGGLAGLSLALEAARGGASVAVLEAGRFGASASGHHLGTVRPGFDVSLDDLIARVGTQDARALWQLSRDGAEHVRGIARTVPDLAILDGALQVSNTDRGEHISERARRLTEEFGDEADDWPTEQVRETLKTGRYFQGIHHRAAFALDAGAYLKSLHDAAASAGVRLYEDTRALALDPSGVRKRISTSNARVRAAHVVLAGNVDLGSAFPRLAATLLPIWRYAASTTPFADPLREAIGFPGSVFDIDGVDHFRIVDGNRLVWENPTSPWPIRPQRYARAIARRVRTVFPQLAGIRIEASWSGATGHTVHGMPQIGQLRPGLWVASGFGRHGIATSGMAALLIAKGILQRDDRWRLMSQFDLVWAGGRIGQLAGHVVEAAGRRRSAAAGMWARQRESIRRRREARATHDVSPVASSAISQESEREKDEAL